MSCRFTEGKESPQISTQSMNNFRSSCFLCVIVSGALNVVVIVWTSVGCFSDAEFQLTQQDMWHLPVSDKVNLSTMHV